MCTEAIQSLQNFNRSRLLSMVKGSWLLIAILTSLMYSRRPLRNRSDKLYRQGWWFHWSVRGFFSQYTYVLTQYSRKHCRKWREQPNTITSNSSVTVVFKKKLLKSLVLYVVLVCVFTFFVPCCDVRYNFRIKRSVRFYLQLFWGGLMSHLPYLCVCMVVPNIYCVVFFLSCVPYVASLYLYLLCIFDCPFDIL